MDHDSSSIIIDADRVASFSEETIRTAVTGVFEYAKDLDLPVQVEWEDAVARDTIQGVIDECEGHPQVEWKQKPTRPH